VFYFLSHNVGNVAQCTVDGVRSGLGIGLLGNKYGRVKECRLDLAVAGGLAAPPSVSPNGSATMLPICSSHRVQ
jgi:hypothetical protein